MIRVSKNAYKKISIILTVAMIASLLLPVMAVAATSVSASGDGTINTWTDITGNGGFYQPAGVAVDNSGNVYVTDWNNEIKKLSNGTWADITGDGGFHMPYGVAVDSSGNVYVAESYGQKIKELTGGKWTDISGNGRFNSPSGVAVDTSGNVYVTDYWYSIIKKLTNGTWSDITGDGHFYHPGGIAVDSSGNVYVADTDNKKIKKLANGSSTWTDITGNGSFYGPIGVAVDNSGNVYVADAGNVYVADADDENSRIKKLSNGTWADITGDGGFHMLYGVAVDSSGNVYVVDLKNSRIKKLTATVSSDIKVVIDGKIQTYPQPPVMVNDRVMVPLRGIFESLGATVKWDDQTQTVTATKGDTTIVLKIGDAVATKNGIPVTLAQPALIINDRTMVPVRFVSEALGAEVKWDSATQTVNIDTHSVIITADNRPDLHKDCGQKMSDFTLTPDDTAILYNSATTSKKFVDILKQFIPSKTIPGAVTKGTINALEYAVIFDIKHDFVSNDIYTTLKNYPPSRYDVTFTIEFYKRYRYIDKPSLNSDLYSTYAANTIRAESNDATEEMRNASEHVTEVKTKITSNIKDKWSGKNETSVSEGDWQPFISPNKILQSSLDLPAFETFDTPWGVITVFNP